MEHVIGLGIAVFLTTWRTVIPLKLGSTRPFHRAMPIVDALIFGFAAGYAGGPNSAERWCALAAVAIAALGFGYAIGIGAAISAWIGGIVGAALDNYLDSITVRGVVASIVVSAVVVLVFGIIGRRLILAEQRRQTATGQAEMLSDANDLLALLLTVARSLPTSLNQREALEGARRQLMSTFTPSVLCLLEYDETENEWTPKLAEGCVLRPSMTTDQLPEGLALAYRSPGAVLEASLSDRPGWAISAPSEIGIYVRLEARDRVVGLLGLEHPAPDQFGQRDRRLLDGMADIVALTLDNARRFGQLRSLGAEEERTRIARDLHDRLGQWLTYISFELERIIATEDQASPELGRLYKDVQKALEELRETLRQLRSEVTVEQPPRSPRRRVGPPIRGSDRHHGGVDRHESRPSPSGRRRERTAANPPRGAVEHRQALARVGGAGDLGRQRRRRLAHDPRRRAWVRRDEGRPRQRVRAHRDARACPGNRGQARHRIESGNGDESHGLRGNDTAFQGGMKC